MKDEKRKTEVRYYLDMLFIAPQNSVDENGKPVLTYSRTLGLDKSTYSVINDQLKAGKTTVFIPQKGKLFDGQVLNSFTVVNLNNPMLIKANTSFQEIFTDEGIKEQQKTGKTVLYSADNKPIVRQ